MLLLLYLWQELSSDWCLKFGLTLVTWREEWKSKVACCASFFSLVRTLEGKPTVATHNTRLQLLNLRGGARCHSSYHPGQKKKATLLGSNLPESAECRKKEAAMSDSPHSVVVCVVLLLASSPSSSLPCVCRLLLGLLQAVDLCFLPTHSCHLPSALPPARSFSALLLLWGPFPLSSLQGIITLP